MCTLPDDELVQIAMDVSHRHARGIFGLADGGRENRQLEVVRLAQQVRCLVSFGHVWGQLCGACKDFLSTNLPHLLTPCFGIKRLILQSLVTVHNRQCKTRQLTPTTGIQTWVLDTRYIRAERGALLVAGHQLNAQLTWASKPG